MSGAFDFAWAAAADLSAYESFLAETYGATAVQAEPGRARWLYWENPLGLHVALCRRDGRIIGACGHLPLPVWQGSQITSAGFGIDMMVAPDHRRRGIGRRLLDMRLSRFDLSLSAGQSRNMAAVYGSAGAHDLGPFRLARSRRSLPTSSGLRPFLRDLGAWILPRLRPRPRDVRRLPLPVPAAAARLATAAPTPAAPRQGEVWANWLTWRYGGPLYRDYDCWEIAVGKGPDGILVTRAATGHEILVDLIAPTADLPALLSAAALTSQAPELIVLAAGGVLQRALASAGYLVRPHGAHLVVMASAGGDAAAIDAESLFFLMGVADADLLRPPPGP